MKNLWKKRVFISGFLIVCSFMFYSLTGAEDKCPYHQEHNEQCEYVASADEQKCQHEHNESCYKKELICTLEEHVHNECYDENENLICALKEHIHDETCYKKTLVCIHTHDENCGYVEAIVGHECIHRCSYCDKELIRTGKLSGDVKDNQYTLHVESTLKGIKGDDQVYFYLKMNKDLLNTCDLEKINEGYRAISSDLKPIILEPTYLSDDLENVYLKFEQNLNSTEKFNISFQLKDDNQDIFLTTASSFNVLDQKEISSLSLKQKENSVTDFVSKITKPDPKATLDFEKWISHITIQHRPNDWSSWQDVGDDHKVKENDQLRFDLQYTIPGGQLSKENNTIQYQLPSGIKAVKESSGKVFNDTNEEVGTYSIQANGLISITFNDDFVDKNAKGQQINGFISFFSSVDSLNTDENGDINLGFNDDLNIDLIVEDKKNNTSDLQVDKEAVYVNSMDGTVDYVIEVTSENGTGSEVILTEIMDARDVLKLVGTIEVKDKDGNSIDIENPPAEGSTRFTLTLPQMSAGQKYTIKYTAQLVNPIKNATAIGNNSVKVESTNNGGAKLEDTDNVDTIFNNIVLRKDGWRDGNTIHWTITVNESEQDISGWMLTDKINGELLPKDTVIHISPAVGDSDTITLPFTFPENSNKKYVITYDTQIDRDLGQGGTSKNIATIKPDDGSGNIDASKDVVHDFYNPLNKWNNSLSINPDGKTANLKWSIQVNTSLGAIKAPWTLKEELQIDEKVNQWFTQQQLDDAKTAIDSAFEGKGLSYEFVGTPGKTSGTYKGFEVHFNTELPKDQNIIFEVESTADLPSVGNALNYRNIVSIGDVYKPADKWYYRDLVVKKYDLNNKNTNDTNHDYYDKELDKNGILKWGVEITLPIIHQNQDIYIHEKLPLGVSLLDDKGLEIQVDNVSWYQEIKFKDNKGTVNIGNHTVEATLDNNIITIHLPKELVQVIKGNKIHLNVRTKIDDNFIWKDENGDKIPDAAFKNEVDVTTEDGTIIGNDNHTQVITKDEGTGTVDKSHSDYKDGMIPYSITINPDGRDLLKDADTILLKDIMTHDNNPNYYFSATLVPNSVKVYYINDDGNKVELSKDLYSYTYEEKVNGNQLTHELLITIPDSTALIVEYKYKVIGNPGIWAKFNNKAALEGFTSSSSGDNNEISISIKESEAGANIKGVFIYKVDSMDNSKYLKGAEFDLYRWDSGKNQYMKMNDTPLITDEKGQLLLKDLAYNTAYKIIETKAPNGYLKSDKEYTFMIVNADKVHYPDCKPSDFEEKGGAYKMFGDVIYYPNVKNSTSIEVIKKWQDANGNETEVSDIKVKFELWKKTTVVGENSDNITFKDQCIGEYEIVAPEWKTIINDLLLFGEEVKDGNKVTVSYQYYVKEIPIENFHISYDNNGGIDKGTITITNKNLLVLPETGGIGTMPYVIIGISMVCISIVFFLKKKYMIQKEGDSL